MDSGCHSNIFEILRVGFLVPNLLHFCHTKNASDYNLSQKLDSKSVLIKIPARLVLAGTLCDLVAQCEWKEH